MQTKQSQKLKKQNGFAVVGALMALMIMSIMIITFIRFENHQKIKDSAKTLGNKIAMVVNATQMRLSSDKTFVDNTYTIKSLINKTCGGTADDNFLPCGFTLKSDIYNGDVLITVQKSEAGAKTDLAVVETTSIGHLNAKTGVIEPVPYLAGASLLAAQIYGADSGTVSYQLDKQRSVITANIVVQKNISTIPTGTVFSFSGSTVPTGFLECDGKFYDIKKYPQLYQVLGISQVPDLRGEFVRGWDHGAGDDTGRVLGSSQGDAIRNITGGGIRIMQAGGTANPTGAFVGGMRHYAAQGTSSAIVITGFDASRVVPTANENRPKNIALMYIIRHD